MSFKQPLSPTVRPQRPTAWLLGAGIIAFVVALYALLLLTTAALQAADDQPTKDDRFRGILVARPAGVAGEWQVGERLFQASAATEIKVENGPLEVGACTEVEYHDANLADFIRSLPARECNENNTATPSASPSPSSTANATVSATPDATRTPETTTTPGATVTTTPGGDERKAFGRVETMPDVGLLGEWTVNGVKYNTSAVTRLRQDDGPFVPGACVEVRYVGQSAPFSATEIRSQEGEKCLGDGSSTPTGTTTPNATTTATPSVTATPNDNELEIYGRVNTLPAGLIGTWVVSNTTYTATAATEFKQEHGAFAVAVCVKIHTTTNVAPFTIREIETTNDFRCASNPAGIAAQGELFGLLQSFPANLIGDWNIAGLTFVADAATQFKQEGGPFTVGMTVKVHFVIGADRVMRAREIETKFANDNNGQDDDRNGAHDGKEGHAFGPIDSFPTNLAGAWNIGGVEYLADGSTRFKQEHGAFAQGVNVRVKFYLDANRNRVAREIKVTDDRGGVDDQSHRLLVGFVQRMPANGFSGAWVVGDVTLVAAATTQFKENNGLLGLGAYVTVEYSTANGVNLLHEIETRVPPGAGNNLRIGKLDSLDDNLAQVATVTANRTWQVAGVNYLITSATDLNEHSGAFAVGSQVLVNSYSASDGSQVATRIQTVTLNQFVYLPLASR